MEANICSHRLEADQRHSHSRLSVQYGRAIRSTARPHRRLNAHRPKRSAREKKNLTTAYCGRAIGVNLWRPPTSTSTTWRQLPEKFSPAHRTMLARPTCNEAVAQVQATIFLVFSVVSSLNRVSTLCSSGSSRDALADTSRESLTITPYY